MIIFEGVDRTGKTTAAQALAKRLGWQYLHFGVPTKRCFEFHMEGIKDVGERVVVDRLHWSEYAYGLTYREGVGYTESEWHFFEDHLMSLDAIVVLMSDSVEKIRSRWGSTERFDSRRIDQLVERFDELHCGFGAIYPSRIASVAFELKDVVGPDGSFRDEVVDELIDESFGHQG